MTFLQCHRNHQSISRPGDGLRGWNAKDTIRFPDNPDVCHLYASAGTYAVSLTIRDNLGVSDTYTHDQVVMPDPIAAFTYSISCENHPVQFTDASNNNGGGNIISWNWNFGDPLSGINNTSSLRNAVHILYSR